MREVGIRLSEDLITRFAVSTWLSFFFDTMPHPSSIRTTAGDFFRGSL